MTLTSRSLTSLTRLWAYITEPSTDADPRSQLHRFFAWMFAAAVIWRITSSTDEAPLLTKDWSTLRALIYLQLAIASYYVLFPRRYGVFIALFVTQLVYACLKMPIYANHHMMIWFMSVAFALLLCMLLLSRERPKLATSWSVNRIAPLYDPFARMMLIIMYFWGTFHKLNWDYLNVKASCATTIYSTLPLPFGLAEAEWAHYAAIYGSLLLEGAAIGLLFSQRYKYYGMVIGLLFHGALGVATHYTLAHFSSLAFALHMLFLPASAFTQWHASKIAGWLRKNPMQWRMGGLMFLALLYYTTVAELYPTMRFLWGVFAAAIIAFVVQYGKPPAHATAAPRPTHYYRSPSATMNLMAVLFLLNGASPYIGLKTESSLSMFSNLHVEGGVSNHILISKPPYLFDFIEAKNIVQIHDSSNFKLKFKYAQKQQHITLFELQRILGNSSNTTLDFVYQGSRNRVWIDNHPLFSSPPKGLGASWLIFKPIDWSRPKPCSH